MSAGEIYGCTWDKGVRQSYVRVLNIFFSIILMNNKYIIRIFLKELSVHGYFRVLDLAAVGTIVDIFGRRRVGMRFKPITYPIQRADALCATPPLLRVYILSWIMFRIRSCRFLRIFTLDFFLFLASVASRIKGRIRSCRFLRIFTYTDDGLFRLVKG